MKKILLSMILAVAALGASAQDNKLAVNAGVLFPSTLNATVGYERSFTYGNAVNRTVLERVLLGRRADIQAQTPPV